MDKIARAFFAGIIVFALAACGGGGGSSSSGGGANTRQFVGNYTGSARLTLASQGRVARNTSRVFVAVRSNGQMDIYFDGELAVQVTSLNSSRFAVTDSAHNAGFDNCSGTVSLVGSIDGNTISGTFSSRGVVCRGVGFTATGSMTATKVVNTSAPAKSRSAGGTFSRLYRQF